jgi:TPR repeat protein
MTSNNLLRILLAASLLSSCLSRQVSVVDPACAQGIEILNSAKTDQDLHEARSLFETSCMLGHGSGCFHLALMYDRGLGGHEDQQTALQLLQRSCDLGESKGCSLFNARVMMLDRESDNERTMSIGWP